MRALVQRVTSARVAVRSATSDGAAATSPAAAPREEVVGSIGAGLCVLVGVAHDDDEVAARRLAEKVWQLRILADGAGAMNTSLADRAAAGESAEVLVVSQFTLYGDTRKGRRPSFVAAARPEHAEPLVDAVASALRSAGARVETGRFGADMAVSLVNDGPVTLMLEV